MAIENVSMDLLKLFDTVSEEAKTEKNAAPPISRMTYWWTRKPLVVGKAIALTSTSDDINKIKKRLNIKKSYREYKNIPTLNKEKVSVLDPFGGSGNLIFPAIQIGLDVTISDYNPLAHIIQRSVLEFPPKYGQKLVDDIKYYANELVKYTENEVGRFFPKKHLAYLWCWCIKCPHCGQRFPLTNNMHISKKNNIGINIISKRKDFIVEIIHGIAEEDGEKFTHKGRSAICISCRNSIDYDAMTKDIQKRKDREMIVVQIQKTKGRYYVLPTKKDKKIYESTKDYLKQNNLTEFIPIISILPSHGKKNTLWHYGIKYWNEYYDPRQLLVLCTLVKGINSICDNIVDPKYRKVMAVYLSTILAKRVDMAGFGVQWDTSAEKPGHILTMRRPSIAHNFVESNPFEKSPGSLPNIVNNIVEGVLFATRLPTVPKCRLESVTSKSDIKYDLIITDPPYGDDVQFGELSEFLYVWVHMALKKYFPKLPSRAPLDEDFCKSQGRFGDKETANKFFTQGLKRSFVSMRDKLKDNGLMVVFFAHSDEKTWDLLLESIRNARLQVISSYSIHTENATNVLARNKTSFMSSIVISCRKILEPSTGYIEDIKPIAESSIRNMLNNIGDKQLSKIDITDLLIMTYGKILEACTKHTDIKSYERDFKPTFETLVKDSRDFLLSELLKRLTGKSIDSLGSEMSAYLLIKIFYNGAITGNDTIKITRTLGLSIVEFDKLKITKKIGNIRNFPHLQEYNTTHTPEDIDENNTYQQLCHISSMINSNNTNKIPKILAMTNFRDDHLRQITSLLIKNHRIKRSSNIKDKAELLILETLADIMGIKVEATLDYHF